METILEDKKFIKKEIDLSESHGFKVLGFFPYATKYIREEGCRIVSVPRQMFFELEELLEVNDNKVVVICKDTTCFGTNNFAIQFKDSFCRLSHWYQVKDY